MATAFNLVDLFNMTYDSYDGAYNAGFGTLGILQMNLNGVEHV